MPLQKESYSAGNKYFLGSVDAFFFCLGIAASGIVIWGFHSKTPQIFYVVGSLLLLCTAIHFKLNFFIALELIIISGHGAALLNLGLVTQLALPALLSFQLFFYYLISNQLYNIYRLMGVIGVALLTISFAYKSVYLFFSGSLLIAVYAFYQTLKISPVAILWGILNTGFAVISLWHIILG